MAGRWLRWPSTCIQPAGRAPLAFGADYNPEQWSADVWREDVELMRAAGVNIVNLGIFSWAEVQPAADEWRFGWLDDVLDLMHEGGIAVDLATGTASPPPWLTELHPEILPVTADGITLSPGGRQHWRPTSPVFRRYALQHVRTIAQRYGEHPALAMWHVSNELGCHNIYDFSDDAAVAFRDWLRARYETLDALNAAWGTAFWSQRYSSFDAVLPPRRAASYPNPTQQLDFARFSSDALKDYFRREAAILRELTPAIPITTNFMVMGDTKGMNFDDWASEVDIVSNDHYLLGARTDASAELCFSANLVRGIADNEPWFLMEHATGAVNWQPVNLPKAPGQLRRDSLVHVAHGSDSVSYFQWRQSAAGAEKYHSGMVPHAGTNSRLWREVCELGENLAALGAAGVAGSRSVPAQVAVLFDWPSWWASELDSHPSAFLRYRDIAIAWYKAIESLGIGVDVQPASKDLTGYAMVVAPTLYVVDDDTRKRLQSYVETGGHLVTTFFSGIVDENDHVHLGGYPGALRELLGIRVEEFAPLLPGESVAVAGAGSATLWAEEIDVVTDDVETLLSYAGTNGPVVTRRTVGTGSASYVGAMLDDATLRSVVDVLAHRSQVVPEVDPAVGADITRRVRTTLDERFTFLINHSAEPRRVATEHGVELLTGATVTGDFDVPARGVAAIRTRVH